MFSVVAAAAPSYRDFISSIVRAKTGKKKSRLDKSKSADLDPDQSAVGASRLAARRQACVSDEFPAVMPSQRAVSDDADLAFEVRHYPAYRFEPAGGIESTNMTENAKPRMLHRTSHSCESLRVHRDRIGHGSVTHGPACVSSSLLPPSYPYSVSLCDDDRG
jgi:hypothetical protein